MSTPTLLKSFLLSFLCAVACASLAGEPAKVLKVWLDGIAGPKPEGNFPKEEVLPPVPKGKPVVRLANVSSPELLVFPAPKDKATGTAVVILPGGGFSKLAMDLEGTEVAEHFNTLGVTAFVLKYRTLPEKQENPALGPAMDAQRSVSLVRSRAAEFGVRADRIGMLGISAGGQSALIATSNHARRLYEPKADADKASCRPDFLALVYPWKIQDAKDATKEGGGQRDAFLPAQGREGAVRDAYLPEGRPRLRPAPRRRAVPDGLAEALRGVAEGERVVSPRSEGRATRVPNQPGHGASSGTGGWSRHSGKFSRSETLAWSLSAATRAVRNSAWCSPSLGFKNSMK
ncbi:MAG: alpha/beta hydrolase [Verrucomicrobia bacterium]|nr:alpha/beta hydrolase [Verrucomicrobiota bacterium]